MTPKQFPDQIRRDASGDRVSTRRGQLLGGVIAVAMLASCGTTPDPVGSLPRPSDTLPPLLPTETLPDITSSETVSPSTTSEVPVPETPLKELQVVYQGELANGWKDVGWDKTRKVGGGPARIDFGNGGGWLITGQAPKDATAIEFRYRIDESLGAVARVIVGEANVENVGREIRLSSRSPVDEKGFRTARIPFFQINPKKKAIQAIRFAPWRKLQSPAIFEVDSIRFTSGGKLERYGAFTTAAPATPAGGVTTRVGTPNGPRPPKVPVVGLPPAKILETDSTFVVDCAADNKPISPLIYGVAYSGTPVVKSKPWDLYPAANRWGGNTTSRFNYIAGNQWNTANDYFYRNVGITEAPNAMANFLAENDKRGIASAVSVPTLGWIANDQKTYSFPVSEFGPQEQTDPDIPDAGNGKDQLGINVVPGSPLRTSIESTPEMVGEWVGKQLKGKTTMYFLDNEPDLWDSTHRDVHPNPVTYDELLKNTIDYGTAIRKADPNAVIAGPSSWGWPGYFYSAADSAAGFDKAPDRKAHGDLPLIPWYLQSIRKYETENNIKLLDLLDVHFYPQAEGLYGGGVGKTDLASNELRLRMTRGLWDPSYTDESWIGEPVALIPRLRKWIDTFAPGVGISIGEWNFGGETNMSGGLSVAEVLGRFGTEGVTSAYYWTTPIEKSPSFWGFRAYRNYDGAGANFNSTSVRMTGVEQYKTLSAFASRNESGGEITMVMLNMSPDNQRAAQVQFASCFRLRTIQAFTYAGGEQGYTKGPEMAVNREYFTMPLAPYSITVVRAKMS